MNPLTADLFTCDGCGLISSDLKPDINIYDRAYAEKYVKYGNSQLGKVLNKLRRAQVQRRVDHGLVLDFGCGAGTFHAMLNHGLNGHGYDVNPYGGFNDREVIDSFPFTAVTMWDVIEHIENPVAVIKSVNAKYLFVCTPSTDDLTSLDEITKWRHYRPYEHVHYFNERSLRVLFTACGYEVKEINYDESCLRIGGGDKNILTMIGQLNG